MTDALCRLIALHGFLGGPRDWDSLRGAIPWAEIDPVDIWPITAAAGTDAWGSVGGLLEGVIAERARRQPLLPAVVLGYSFGARLALAVNGLADGSLPVAGVSLVSCNPGLPDEDTVSRESRREADERWARMLMDSSEAEIRSAWNAQPALSGNAVPGGAHSPLPAPRYTLAVAMRRFTLAGQPDFRPRLLGWRTPLLWLTGERDAKFTAIAREIESAGSRADFVVCEDAGHRVPWDNPQGFEAILRRWLAGTAGIGRQQIA